MSEGFVLYQGLSAFGINKLAGDFVDKYRKVWTGIDEDVQGEGSGGYDKLTMRSLDPEKQADSSKNWKKYSDAFAVAKGWKK